MFDTNKRIADVWACEIKNKIYSLFNKKGIAIIHKR